MTLREQAEKNVIAVIGHDDMPGFAACVEAEMKRIMKQELQAVRDAFEMIKDPHFKIGNTLSMHINCGYEKVINNIQTIRTALTEYEKLLSGEVVVVPRNPTGPMLMLGIHAHERNDDLPDIGLGPKCLGIYRAMISAAPVSAKEV